MLNAVVYPVVPMNTLAYFVIAANAGVMLFFTVAVAPFIFRVLPPEWAGRYVRSFFPRYYAYLFAASLVPTYLLWPGQMGVINLSVAVLFLFNWLGLTPAVNNATDRGHKRQFAVLHTVSIAINFVQLGLLIWCLYEVLKQPAIAAG